MYHRLELMLKLKCDCCGGNVDLCWHGNVAAMSKRHVNDVTDINKPSLPPAVSMMKFVGKLFKLQKKKINWRSIKSSRRIAFDRPELNPDFLFYFRRHFFRSIPLRAERMRMRMKMDQMLSTD